MSLLFNFIFVLLLNVALSLKVNNFSLKRCASTDGDSITLENVTFVIKNGKPVLIGAFKTSVDLKSPIKTEVKLQRKVLIGDKWKPVPCVNNVGSCIYTDTCTFGLPDGEECPPEFEDLPCRCPIAQGTYKIPSGLGKLLPANLIPLHAKATVTASADGIRLACYEAELQITL